jgi:hypothetical protein
MLPKRESLPAVTAAAVVAIVFAVLGVLGGLLIELSMLLIPDVQTSAGRPGIPPGTRAIGGIVWFFVIAVCVFGVFVGVGVLRRRNWARISIIIWAAFMTMISTITIPVMFLVFNAMPRTMPRDANVGSVMGFMKWFIVLFYGIPFCVGIWWLVLFTRKRVSAAFTAPAQAVATYPPTTMDVSGFPLPEPTPMPIAPLTPKPACPLPLMILAGFLIFSAFSMLLIVLVPVTGSMPFFFFGHFYSGLTAKFVLGLMGLLYGAGGVGIFRLKPWAFHTVLGVQLLFLLNGTLSILNPRFLSVMKEAMQQTYAENPALAGGNPFLTGSLLQTFMVIGLCFGAAIVAVMLFYRSRFLEAAAAAKP